ncbi:MAG: hypothetical protein ACRCWJ_22955 [Casimicrobium sp.]
MPLTVPLFEFYNQMPAMQRRVVNDSYNNSAVRAIASSESVGGSSEQGNHATILIWNRTELTQAVNLKMLSPSLAALREGFVVKMITNDALQPEYVAALRRQASGGYSSVLTLPPYAVAMMSSGVALAPVGLKHWRLARSDAMYFRSGPQVSDGRDAWMPASAAQYDVTNSTIWLSCGMRDAVQVDALSGAIMPVTDEVASTAQSVGAVTLAATSEQLADLDFVLTARRGVQDGKALQIRVRVDFLDEDRSLKTVQFNPLFGLRDVTAMATGAPWLDETPLDVQALPLQLRDGVPFSIAVSTLAPPTWRTLPVDQRRIRLTAVTPCSGDATFGVTLAQ